MKLTVLVLMIIWTSITLMPATHVLGLSLPGLSNVRNFDEQIRLAYKPEVEEVYRPGRFLIDDAGDEDFNPYFSS